MPIPAMISTSRGPGNLRVPFALAPFGHRVITHRDVTDVPTFFVRMLGKLLEFTGIEYAIQDGGSPFKLAEHAQLIIFRQAA